MIYHLHRSPLRRKGSSLTKAPEPRAPGHQKEPAQHLAMKICGDSIHPSEKEGGWKPRCSLKKPACRFTGSQALALGSGKGTMAFGGGG